MTREQIIRVAEMCGVMAGYEGEPDRLLKFASVMAATEREACAKLVGECVNIELLADAIRARNSH